MNKTSIRLCAHAGLLYCVLMGLGIFWTAGWLPVVAPTMGAAEVAQMFERDKLAIRIGISILAAASVLFWPFAAAISTQMRSIEGGSHPLADVQRATANGSVLAVILPSYVWLALTYRTGTVAPETMQLANDFAWLCFVGMYPPATLQAVVLGLCILRGEPQAGVYPRWLGYLNLWFALLFLPGALLPFFKTGPFAWNGLISFWMVASLFFGWILIMWWATLRAAGQVDRLGRVE